MDSSRPTTPIRARPERECPGAPERFRLPVPRTPLRPRINRECPGAPIKKPRY